MYHSRLWYTILSLYKAGRLLANHFRRQPRFPQEKRKISRMADGPMLDDKLHWYKDAVIYEVHIKAFRDANGDGIGDFAGLLEKLDYLQDLGVTAIWLLPFYPSPLRDDGYDIADYYSINPAYGDLTQFQALLEDAHAR